MNVDCINCSIRRLSCDRSEPSCGNCVRLRNSCNYEWTLDTHIYQLFPAYLNLSEAFHFESSSIVHATRTARIYKADMAERGAVAVKVLWESAAPGRLLQLAVRESYTWSRLQHNNIVPLFGIADVASLAVGIASQLCMISPWMSEGNVMDFVHAHPDADRLPLLSDIVKGVEYLHSLKPNKVIHGDLKGNNVLVDISTGRPCARLTDFGLSSAIEEYSEMYPAESTTTSYRGNPRWLAPERLSPGKFGAKSAQDAHSTSSDVFEMMRTFLQILTGKEPFHEYTNEIQVINALSQGGNPQRPSGTIRGLDERMWDLMCRSWHQDRDSRPRLFEISDSVEDLVVEAAVRDMDLKRIDSLDIDHMLLRMRRPNALRPSTTILLIDCLRIIGHHDRARLYGLPNLLGVVGQLCEVLPRLLQASRRDSALMEIASEIFCFLAALAKSAKHEERRRIAGKLSAYMSLPSLLQFAVSLRATQHADLREISTLFCRFGPDITMQKALVDNPEQLSHLLSSARTQALDDDEEVASAALLFLLFYVHYVKAAAEAAQTKVTMRMTARFQTWVTEHKIDMGSNRRFFFAYLPEDRVHLPPETLVDFRRTIRVRGEVDVQPTSVLEVGRSSRVEKKCGHAMCEALGRNCCSCRSLRLESPCLSDGDPIRERNDGLDDLCSACKERAQPPPFPALARRQNRTPPSLIALAGPFPTFPDGRNQRRSSLFARAAPEPPHLFSSRIPRRSVIREGHRQTGTWHDRPLTPFPL